MIRVEANGVVYSIKFEHVQDYLRQTHSMIMEPGEDGVSIVVGYGVTTVHPKDTYCKETGRKVSLARALQAAFPYDKAMRARFWNAYLHRPRSVRRDADPVDVSKSTPKVVCLCGSGRFRDAFDEAEMQETLAGKIVLTIGCNTHDVARTPDLSRHKPMLDELHLRKIDLADEVLILNVDGYIGESTRRELTYALEHRKTVRFLACPHDGFAGQTPDHEKHCLLCGAFESDVGVSEGDKDDAQCVHGVTENAA